MRETRLGLNEALFRDLNEQRLTSRADGRTDESRLQVYCECANVDCIGRIVLTAAEFEAVRADPVQFVVLPGHEVVEAEVVVAVLQDGKALVVRKQGEAAEVAELTDPHPTADETDL